MSKYKGVKKTLAVFMAALMVLSCWVFTPIATEAEAAQGDPGSYYYKVVIWCTDGEDSEDDFSGCSWRLYGKDNYGNGTQNPDPAPNGVVIEQYKHLYNETTKLVKSSKEADKYFTIFEGYTTEGWFPTMMHAEVYTTHSFIDSKKVSFYVMLYIGSSDKDAKLIYTSDLTKQVNEHSQDYEFDKKDTYSLPTPKEVKLANANSDSLIIPKVGESAKTVDCSAAVYDQYGVQMTNHTPTYYLNSTKPTSYPTSNDTIAGVTLSGSTLNVTSDALLVNSDKKTVYVSAVNTSASDTNFVTKEITLNDPEYTWTFNPNGGTIVNSTGSVTKQYYNEIGTLPEATREGFEFKGWYTTQFADSYETPKYNESDKLAVNKPTTSDVTYYAAWQAKKSTVTFKYIGSDGNWKGETKTGYFGRNLVAPIPTTVSTTDMNYTYTGWDKTPSTTFPESNTTYTAKYNETPNYADLTKLNEQLKKADEIKANDEYYKGKGYTDETINAFDDAYNAAKAYGATTPKSAQNAVDKAAEALEKAIKQLTIKKFVVLFVDETNAIIANGYHYVQWGESVDVPDSPIKAYDNDNHYKFNGWNEDPEAFCASVKDDKVFTAKFIAESHSFTDTPTASTCTTDGVITKTCSCGYSYTVTKEDDLAHHDFELKTIIEATCSSKGATAQVCKNCGAIEEDTLQSVDAKAHDYDETNPTVVTAATCLGEGVSYYTCKACGAKEYFKTDKLSHNWDTTKVSATCTADGYTIQTCSVCGLSKISAKTSKSGHSTKTTTVSATCTSYGYTLEECSKCDYSKVTMGNTLAEHKYTTEKDIAATCISYGYKEEKCSDCGDVNRTIYEKISHNYSEEFTIDVHATCTAEGSQSKHCTVCGDKSEVTVINKLEHNLVDDNDNSQAATCTQPSITAKKCLRCDYTTKEVGAALGHDLQATTTVAATCNNAGYKVWKCQNTGCDYGYTEYTNAATGNHNWTFTTSQAGTQLTVKGECSSCKAKTETTVTVAEGHTYSSVSVTKQPTCKETGTIVIACDKKHKADCTATIEATLPINPDAHKNIITAYTQADCTNDVKVVTTCSDCNAKIAETTIPATGHSYAEYVKDEVVATCTTKGKIVLKCTNNNCDSTKTIETSTNPNAHKYTLKESVGATCTDSAYDIYECEYCKNVSYKQYKEGGALDHDWSEAVVQQNGNLITVTRTCKRDGCKQTETVLTNKEIDNRHDYSGKVETVTAATCKTEGKIKVYCKDEGCDSYVEINIGTNAKAHTLETKYKAPDCLSDGYVKTYCTECTNELSNQEIDKLGHDFSVAGDITTPASCTAAGKQTYKCSRCEETTEVVIPKLGHDYEITETHNATCTTYGYYVKKCKNCHDTYNELIKESGHKLTGKETVAPTCTEQGYDKQYCKACGEWIKSNYVNASGHNFDGEGTVVTPPTCKAGGYTTYTCQNEGCTYSYVGDYTPTSSHDYTGENSVVVTPPTCTSKGYTTHRCKNCEYYFIDTYVDAIGHDFDKTKGEAGVDAETGKNYTKYPCKHECGEYQYEYVGDGCTHANCEYVKTVAPTCTQDGYDIYSCPTCKDNEIKTNFKSALGHNWDYWTIKTYPTETSNGLQERGCKNCTAKETEEIVYGKYYLVTFYNYDGTRLIRPAYYSYGKAAKMPDFTPTRVADVGYTYTFKGYNYTQGEINCVTKRMAVMAEYEAHERSYAVTYQNEDGTVLQTVSSVKYTNITSAYTAGTPTKASDEYYTYTFNSWSVNYNTDNGTAVATATYTQKLTDSNKTPDGNEPGILTKFIEWLKAFIKKLFGIG